MTAQRVTDTLPHHSDQASTSGQFQRLIADNGLTCSMTRSGNVWDNAAMDSFFSSLKAERVSGKAYRTRNHAKADVFDGRCCTNWIVRDSRRESGLIAVADEQVRTDPLQDNELAGL